MLAATKAKLDAQGRDGSFMKLFRYISGANESKRKIAMRTPVFMGDQDAEASVQMGFVMPKETAGYDPPFTPGPLRRHEVLIRLKASE
jgi:hypothetical protein